MKTFREYITENKHREATPEELRDSLDRHFKHGHKLRFRHYTFERSMKTAKNGVRHIQHSKTKPLEKDGKIYVKHQGREQELTASAMEMDNGGKPIVYDHRLKGLK